MLVRIANRKDRDQTASEEYLSILYFSYLKEANGSDHFVEASL